MPPETQFNIGLITSDEVVLKRCKSVCAEFNYTLNHWTSLEAYIEQTASCSLLIVSAYNDKIKEESSASAQENMQVLRQYSPNSLLVCIVDNVIPKLQAAEVKKCGANWILFRHEVTETCKLEFIASQNLRATYIPVKINELVADSTLTFDLYHLLPLNKKFLKFIREGSVLDGKQMTKFSGIGEVYLHRDQIESFSKYVHEHPMASAGGVASRCRAIFHALCSSYTALVMHLTDQSQFASYNEGEELLKKVRQLSDSLLETLGAVGNAWDIVNQSAIGEFGSVERAPVVAAYAAIFGLEMDMERINEMMLAALLSELGLLYLPPGAAKKIRDEKVESMTPEETMAFQQYPLKSLNVALERKLGMPEKMRDLILCIHEQADGKGFPGKKSGSKIPEHSQLIQFCEQFDRKTLIRMGRQRVDAATAREELIKQELRNLNRYSPILLSKLKHNYIKTGS
jgi:response regulator RpfG family c-di-GMP phosphodiesterase